MLVRNAHLTVHRPSPTTVRFTVSSASARNSVASRAVHTLLLFLRIFFGLGTCFVIVLKASGYVPDGPLLQIPARELQATAWSHLGPLAFISLFLVFRRFHTEESLLVLRTLGIQTSSLSASYLIPSSTRFIPTSQIRNIFIHEAFRGFEVRYYLAAVVEGEAEVVVVFPKLLPGRAVVETVWRGARECLYEPKQEAGERID